MSILRAVLAAVGVWLTFLMAPVYAESNLIEVDMQLVLAVDISFSVSLDEQDIQRRGYIAAFRDPDVIRAITSGFRGRIAVTYLEWAGADTQIQVAPWTLIVDPVTARAFAQKLENTPVNRKGRTSMSQALSVALGLFQTSPFQSNRHVVDISSDGFNNNGPRIDRMRDALVYHGVTINGLPLMQDNGTDPKADLGRYFDDCVIGGLGAFTMPVTRWDEFGVTLKRKLISEIARQWQPPTKTRIIQAAGVETAGPAMDCLYGEKAELKEYIRQLEEAVGKDRAPRWMPRQKDWPMPD